MKTNLLTLFLFLLCSFSFAQIIFEKGYILDTNNHRIECLIKNNDWKLNPNEFEYKLNEHDTSEQGNLLNIKEFGIIGLSRFVRADVKIDISPWEITKLSKVRNPEWSQQQLFLKVFVEGKASLYYFASNELVRFFYSVDDTTIKQLIYKQYFVDDDHVATNRKFREQLWLDMRCENAKMSSVENLDFKKNSLMKYFENYNQCNGKESLIYGKIEKKDFFHLRITPGINISSVSISDNFYEIYNTEFKNQLGFRTGIEAEYILPFNKNKWGILFEPTFQHLYSVKQIKAVSATINYNSIEFSLGIRHYFFLKKELKLFVNAFFVPGYSLNFNSTITYDYPFASPLEIKTNYSVACGGGISFKKISAEMRYYTQRDMLDNFYWISKYGNFSAIFGFKLF